MSSSSSRRSAHQPAVRSKTIWTWRRRVLRREEDEWTARLETAGYSSWSLTEKPGQTRMLLTVYLAGRSESIELIRKWGGRAESVSKKMWLSAGPATALKIGPELRIFHQRPASRTSLNSGELYIPHGLAFGSGEHSTTFMLLRELMRHDFSIRDSVLDLGTGSGILALTARRLGVKRIVATDFDEEAVRTAQRNEELNFRGALIQWRRGDVKRLRFRNRFALVMANLYSGILCEAAEAIGRGVKRDGELWLSGILRTQRREVEVAYEAEGFHLLRALQRGRWVMLRWRKPAQAKTGGLRKSVQTK